MWIIAAFDLPTSTNKQKRAYREFRVNLLKNGFIMFQFSIYIKHLPTFAKAKALSLKMQKYIPKNGNVVFFFITDKQFGLTKNYIGKKEKEEMSQNSCFYFKKLPPPKRKGLLVLELVKLTLHLVAHNNNTHKEYGNKRT